MKIQAPAKLNLYLEVKGKRPDGYHLLESDVVFLNIYDELEFIPSEVLEVESDIPDNIVLKAALALGANKGMKIRLTKTIPQGAGLGGGSSNAAATLIALNQLWGLNLPEARLYDIALKLGADVPVCLFGLLNKVNFAHFSGIGEDVSFIQPLPDWTYLLVNPNKVLPTKDVFENFHIADIQPPTSAKNDLEHAAVRKVPEIAHALEMLRGSKNNLFARMTGTGATCFAVYENHEDALNAAESVPGSYWKRIAKEAWK